MSRTRWGENRATTTTIERYAMVQIPNLRRIASACARRPRMAAIAAVVKVAWDANGLTISFKVAPTSSTSCETSALNKQRTTISKVKRIMSR